MKKLLLVLGIAVAVGLIGTAAVWACCGQSTFPLEINDIAPTLVPCEGIEQPVDITFSVVVGQTMWPEPGYELDLDTYATVYIDGVEIGVAPATPPLPGWGMAGTYPALVEWTPPASGTYELLIVAYTIDENGGMINLVEASAEIVVEACCEATIRITPNTFNVQRAGNNVMGHVTADEGVVIAGGTIVSIDGIAADIPGVAEPGGPIRFSSEAFSAIAELIVPEGEPRKEDVEVVVQTDACGMASDLIDIINEGK